MRTVFLISLLASVFIPAGYTQHCTMTVEGVVLDHHDDEPLGYATIQVVETGKGVMADDMGRFTLTGICAGEWTLQISHVGCEPFREKVKVSGDTSFVFYLEHHVELLETVIAKGTRLQETASQTRTTLSGYQLEKLQSRSLGEIMSQLSGVTVLQTGPGIQKPVIHGLSGNRILILQHGVRMEGQQWGVDHAPEIDPSMAGSVAVIKGAEGVRYGPDALGGVILVNPEPLPRHKGMSGRLSSLLQSNGRGGRIAGSWKMGLPREGWGLRISGSARMLGDAQAPDYILSNTGLREGSLTIHGGYTGHRHTIDVFYSYFSAAYGILRAAHIGNLTDLQNALNAKEPWYQMPFTYALRNPRQQVDHHTLKLSGSREITSLWTLSGQYSIQRNDRREYDVRRGEKDTKPALDLTIWTQQVDIQTHHRPWRHWKGGIGTTLQYQSNYNLPGTGTRPLIPNYDQWTAALHLTERYIRDQWEWEGGIRYDLRHLSVARFDLQGDLQRPSYAFHNVSALTGGSWHLDQTWKVTFNTGTAFRSPGVNELFSEGLHHASAAIEEGNPDLTVERAWKSILSLEYQHNWFWVTVSGYHQRIDGFIYLAPTQETVLTIRGAFPVFRYEQTDARLQGVDADVGIRLSSSVSWKGQSSFLWAWDRVKDDYIIGMPPFQFRQEWMYRQPFGDNRFFEGNIATQHILRQRMAPAGDFADPPAAYHLLNVALTFDLGQYRITLGADNLFDTTYRHYLDRLRYYADAAGRNFFLQLNLKF